MASATMENCAAANPDQAPDPGWESTGRVSFAACERGNSSVGYLVLAALLAGLVAVVTGTLESGAVESATCAIGRAFDPTIQCAAPNGDDRADNGSNPGRESTDFASAASALQDATHATEPPPASTETVFVTPNANTLPVQITRAQYEGLIAAGANPILVTDRQQIAAAKVVDHAKVVSVDNGPGVHEAWAEMFGAGTITSAVVQEGDAPAQVVLAGTETDVGTDGGLAGPELRTEDDGNLPAVGAGRPVVLGDHSEDTEDDKRNRRPARPRVTGSRLHAAMELSERFKEMGKAPHKGRVLFGSQGLLGTHSFAFWRENPDGSGRLTVTVKNAGVNSYPVREETFDLKPGDDEIRGTDNNVLGRVLESGEVEFFRANIVQESDHILARAEPWSWKSWLGEEFGGFVDMLGESFDHWSGTPRVVGVSPGFVTIENPEGLNDPWGYRSIDGTVHIAPPYPSTADYLARVSQEVDPVEEARVAQWDRYLRPELMDPTPRDLVAPFQLQDTTHPDRHLMSVRGAIELISFLRENPSATQEELDAFMLTPLFGAEAQTTRIVRLSEKHLLIFDPEEAAAGREPYVLLGFNHLLSDREGWIFTIGGHAWPGQLPNLEKAFQQAAKLAAQRGVERETVEHLARVPSEEKEGRDTLVSFLREILEVAPMVREGAVPEATLEKLRRNRAVLEEVAGGPVPWFRMLPLAEDPKAEQEIPGLYREEMAETHQQLMAGEQTTELIYWYAGSDSKRLGGPFQEFGRLAREAEMQESWVDFITNSPERKEAERVYREKAIAKLEKQGLGPGPERDAQVEAEITDRINEWARKLRYWSYYGNGSDKKRSMPGPATVAVARNVAQFRFERNGGREGDAAYANYLAQLNADPTAYAHAIHHGTPPEDLAEDFTLKQYQIEFIQNNEPLGMRRVTVQSSWFDQNPEDLTTVLAALRNAHNYHSNLPIPAHLRHLFRMVEAQGVISAIRTRMGIPEDEATPRGHVFNTPTQNMVRVMQGPAIVPRTVRTPHRQREDGTWVLDPVVEQTATSDGSMPTETNPRAMSAAEVTEALISQLEDGIDSGAFEALVSREIMTPEQYEDLAFETARLVGELETAQAEFSALTPENYIDPRAIEASMIAELGGINNGQGKISRHAVTRSLDMAERIFGEEGREILDAYMFGQVISTLSDQGWKESDQSWDGIQTVRIRSRALRGVGAGEEPNDLQQLLNDYDVDEYVANHEFLRDYVTSRDPTAANGQPGYLWEAIMEADNIREAARDRRDRIIQLYGNDDFVNFSVGAKTLDPEEQYELRMEILKFLNHPFVKRRG